MRFFTETERINIDQPLWDQSTFYGRFRHFAFITDPTTVLANNAELTAAKQLMEQYRYVSILLGCVSSKLCTYSESLTCRGYFVARIFSARREPADTKIEDVIRAKKLFASAFHPDTGELQNFVGRMSFQMPGGFIITAGMLTFYKSVPAVVLWQWINQSFNALVNYTNRNANSTLSVNQMAGAYVMATSSALVAALGCKSYWGRTAGPIMQRYVPFAAVATANCINIPLMRQQELLQGIVVCDENGKRVGTSQVAAAKGISQVVFSRIVMAVPGMVLLPYITSQMEKNVRMFQRLPWLTGPFQLVVNGLL